MVQGWCALELVELTSIFGLSQTSDSRTMGIPAGKPVFASSATRSGNRFFCSCIVASLRSGAAAARARGRLRRNVVRSSILGGRPP